MSDYEIIRGVKASLPPGKIFVSRADCVSADRPPRYHVFSSREVSAKEERSAIESYEKRRRILRGEEPQTVGEVWPWLKRRFLTWWRR